MFGIFLSVAFACGGGQVYSTELDACVTPSRLVTDLERGSSSGAVDWDGTPDAASNANIQNRRVQAGDGDDGLLDSPNPTSAKETPPTNRSPTTSEQPATKRYTDSGAQNANDARGTGPTSKQGTSVKDVTSKNNSKTPDYSDHVKSAQDNVTTTPAAALSQCQSAKESMQSLCVTDSSSELKGVIAGGDAMLFALSSGAMGGGVQGACSQVADFARKANIAMSAWKAACAGAVMRCHAACGAEKGASEIVVAQAKSDKKECSQGTQLLSTGVINIMTLVSGMQQAKQCANQTDPMAAMCKANPFAAGCGMNASDCRNPAMSGTMVCMCQQNPSAPGCAGLANKINGGQSLASLAGAGADGSLPNAGAGAMDGSGFGAGALEYQNFGDSGAGGGGGNRAPGGGGGKSVQASTSGSASGQKNDGGGGAAPSGLNTKIAQGFWGGGGGGTFGGGGGGGGGSGSQPVMASINGRQFDLKKFLPGGDHDPSRRPAGIVGPDGITGPATDLFEKMNTRFMALGHTLRP